MLTSYFARVAAVLLLAGVLSAAACRGGEEAAPAGSPGLAATPLPVASPAATATSPSPVGATPTTPAAASPTATPARPATPAATPAIPTPTPAASPAGLTREQATARIVSALNARSYADLRLLMLPTVRVILQATECCFDPMTSAAAVAQMAYLNLATPPWNFDQTNPVVRAIKTNFPENYGDALVGISANNWVAAFKLNRDNLIEAIAMAVNVRLLVP